MPRQRPGPQAVAAHPHQAGLFLDFDGSLSEIAPSPRQARPVVGAAEVLAGLARSYRVVAIVSGRRAGEVSELLGSPAGVRVFGLYGLEDERGPLRGFGEELAKAMERLMPELERIAASVPGAVVEPKGLQVAVHYRGARDARAARGALLTSLDPLAETAGLRLLEGKRVVELAPPAGPTKGDVVERVARKEGLRYLLYGGDDLADRDAFAAVDRLEAAGVAGVKVAVRSDETPDLLLEAADLVVDGPSGLVALLRELGAAPRTAR